MKFSDIMALAKQGYTPADIRDLSSMGDVKIADIIDLAKQGYKPADIKELSTIAEETSGKPEENAPDPGPAQAVEPAAEEPAAEGQRPAQTEDRTDEKISELENKIKGLQAENTRRPRPEEPQKKSDEEILKDMARRFM